jgi:hypothetical protein
MSERFFPRVVRATLPLIVWISRIAYAAFPRAGIG